MINDKELEAAAMEFESKTVLSDLPIRDGNSFLAGADWMEARCESRIKALEADVFMARKLLREICNEWKEDCNPTCDSYAHDDNCPAVNIKDAFRVKNERINELEKKLNVAIEGLEELASENIAIDTDVDFNPADYSGGNVDDAYSMGVGHGKVLLARRLIANIRSGELVVK